MDDLVGRTMAKCRADDTLLMVLSDHGFNTFRRGDRSEPLAGRERLPGRRRQPPQRGVPGRRRLVADAGVRHRPDRHLHQPEGQVFAGHRRPGAEADRFRDEIADEPRWTCSIQKTERPAIKRVYQATKAYRGPYKDQAPDLIVGYERGYRVSWEPPVGKTTTEVFHDNTKAWSGDHCVDPSVVPGVLFCNRPIRRRNIRGCSTSRRPCWTCSACRCPTTWTVKCVRRGRVGRNMRSATQKVIS